MGLDEIVGKVAGAAETAKEAVEGALDKFDEAMDSETAEKIGNAAEGALDKFSAAAEGVAEKMADAVVAAKDKAEEFTGLDIDGDGQIGAAAEAAEEVADAEEAAE